MGTLTMHRSPDDKHRYDLPGYGSVRVSSSFLKTESTITDERGGQWRASASGLIHRKRVLTTGAGATVGEWQHAGGLAHRGTVVVDGRPYGLAQTSGWKNTYALSVDGTTVATIKAKGYGKEPVTVEVTEGATIPAHALLFAIVLVQQFTTEDTAAVSAGAT